MQHDLVQIKLKLIPMQTRFLDQPAPQNSIFYIFTKNKN